MDWGFIFMSCEIITLSSAETVMILIFHDQRNTISQPIHPFNHHETSLRAQNIYSWRTTWLMIPQCLLISNKDTINMFCVCVCVWRLIRLCAGAEREWVLDESHLQRIITPWLAASSSDRLIYKYNWSKLTARGSTTESPRQTRGQ